MRAFGHQEGQYDHCKQMTISSRSECLILAPKRIGDSDMAEERLIGPQLAYDDLPVYQDGNRCRLLSYEELLLDEIPRWPIARAAEVSIVC